MGSSPQPCGVQDAPGAHGPDDHVASEAIRVQPAVPSALTTDLVVPKERFDFGTEHFTDDGGNLIIVPSVDADGPDCGMLSAWHRVATFRAAEDTGGHITFALSGGALPWSSTEREEHNDDPLR